MLSLISTRVYVEASLLKVRIKERFQEVLVKVKRPHADEDGAIMIEYALLIAGIAVAMIAAIFLLFQAIATTFNNATNAM